jgi:DNA-binding transcriptional regulator YiaG
MLLRIIVGSIAEHLNHVKKGQNNYGNAKSNGIKRNKESTNMTPKQLGREIHRLRRERGLTQAELAQKLDVTVTTVSRWETGSHRPWLTQLDEIARVLEAKGGELQ